MQKVLAKIQRDTAMYKKSFKKFDQDGNGFIDKDELRTVLCGNGRFMSEAEVEVLFHEVDVDGDGKLTYEGNTIFDAINVRLTLDLNLTCLFMYSLASSRFVVSETRIAYSSIVVMFFTCFHTRIICHKVLSTDRCLTSSGHYS
jgi:hypothetical protein